MLDPLTLVVGSIIKVATPPRCVYEIVCVTPTIKIHVVDYIRKEYLGLIYDLGPVEKLSSEHWLWSVKLLSPQ